MKNTFIFTTTLIHLLGTEKQGLKQSLLKTLLHCTFEFAQKMFYLRTNVGKVVS